MSSFLAATTTEFRRYKKLADEGMAQVDEAGFFGTPDAATNSVAITLKHVAGNLRSRWTDFLTTDGEKPDRDRDGEFELRPGDTRARLETAWEEGWRRLFDALASLTAEDLERTVQVRGEPTTVTQALQRSLAHTAYHVGQIVLLARHYAGERWTTLSIPRGGSAAFNAGMSAGRG
jgi:uncharacterized damage-inducible protein DinB